jgi:hypothetical protein
MADHLAETIAPALEEHGDVISEVANTAMSPPSSHSGTPFSTYLLFGDIVILLIGVILIVASQNACASDPNSASCKNQRNVGIAFTVVCGVCLFVILYFKFK